MASSAVPVSVAAAVLAAATSVYTLRVYLPTLNTTETSLTGVPRPPAEPPAPAIARRVAVIVLDGLGYDAARALPELAPLAQRGAIRSVAVEFPTFTSPAVISMMTGVGPRDSGTRRNGAPARVPGLDTIVQAAADAGLPAAVWSHGYSDFGWLVAPPPGVPVHLGHFAAITDIGRRRLADAPAPRSRLDVIHWGLIDDVGHEHGAASPEYAQAARDGIAFVTRYAESLDLDRDALVVISDHGHLARGGHGGAEEEVKHALFLGLGARFRRGVTLPERPMRDIAPTLAALAGLRTPTSSLGLPMLDAIDLDGAETAAYLAPAFTQASRFLCALRPAPVCSSLDPLAARLRARDPSATADAASTIATLTIARDEALASARDAGAVRRLAVTAFAIGVLLGAVATTFRRRGMRLRDVTTAALLLPPLNAAVFLGYLALLGARPGFSFLKAAPELIADAVPGAVLAVGATLIAAFAMRPGRLAPWILLLCPSVPFALLAAWVGADSITPPPPLAGAAVFQLAPAVLTAAAAAVVVSLVERRRAG